MAEPKTERSVIVQSTDLDGHLTVAEYSDDRDLVLIEARDDGKPVLVEAAALYAAAAFCTRNGVMSER